MGYIRRQIFTFSLIILSTLMLVYGCGSDRYKKLKLDVSHSEIEFVLSERPEENLFSVTVAATGLPKGYDGAVNFHVPVNDFVTILNSSPKVVDGKTIATFEAKAQGGPIEVKVSTLEGNLSKTIKIRIVEPIVSVNFAEIENNTIPIVRGQKTDIGSYLIFEPLETLQNNIKLELSSLNPADELIYIKTDGKYLTVPNDVPINEFQMRARSTYDEKIISNLVNVKVIDIIPANEIGIMLKANVPDDEDVLLPKEKGEYQITLAPNTEEHSTKTVYFNFANKPEENQNYTVTITGLNKDGSITKSDGGVNIVQADKSGNNFTLTGLAHGTTKIEFVIKRSDFEKHTHLEQKMILNVTVEQFPVQINVSESKLTYGKFINEITIYKNYDEINFRGAPIYIGVENESNELMLNQNVKWAFSVYDENLGEEKPINERFKVYDRFNVISLEQPLSAGVEYFIRHTFTSDDKPEGPIKLTITSEKYNKIIKVIDINIELEELRLSSENRELTLDVNDDRDIVLEINGLSTDYNYNNLTITQTSALGEDLVEVTQSDVRVTIRSLNKIGETSIRVVAPNGSALTFKITLFESLIIDKTSVTVAGKRIMAKAAKGENVESIITKNFLDLKISFVINDKSYSSLDGLGLSYTIASTNNQIALVDSNEYYIQTQNEAGSTLITIQIIGYDANGELKRAAFFEFNIETIVPITRMEPNNREYALYSLNTLNSNLIQDKGEHKLSLNIAPSNVKLDYSDIIWHCEYNGMRLDFTYVDNGNEMVYTFKTGRSDLIVLKTYKDRFKNAVITSTIAGGSTKSMNFTIVAEVKQEFLNDNGTNIVESKTTDIRYMVHRAEKVENIVFQKVSTYQLLGFQYYEITFDHRDMDHDGSEYTSNNVFDIKYDVFPASALVKTLRVATSSTSIQASVNNETKTISVKILSKISSSGDDYIDVYPIDDMKGDEKGAFKRIQIRVLDGTMANPYEIHNGDDLVKINNALSSHYVLANNVSISNWVPIGYSAQGVVPFTGSLSGKKDVRFDGNVISTSYYGISGMLITSRSDYNYFGLFAYLGSEAVVSDLNLTNFLIRSNIDHVNNVYAGALAGYSEGKVQNVSVNDSSAVETFNGEYYESINKEALTSAGIFITANTSTEYNAYYFIGGLIGFVNNTSLSRGNNLETYNLKTTDSQNLFSNYTLPSGDDKVQNERVDQLVNVSATLQMDVYVGLNNVSFVGGLVGFNNRAVITSNQQKEVMLGGNSAEVITSINANLKTSEQSHNQNSAFGGAVGFNNGIVENIYTKANVMAFTKEDASQSQMSNIGGVVGFNTGTIEGTKAYPLLRGNQNIGGIVGKSTNAIVYLESTIGGKKYTYVNGKEKISSNFSVNNSMEFNIKFKIKLDEFENIIYSYDDMITFINANYPSVNVDNLLGISGEEAYVKASTFTIIKITTNDLFQGVQITDYCIRSEGAGRNLSIAGTYNACTTNQIAIDLARVGINIVKNNSVEFLDLQDSKEVYNTAIIANNNVGGLVGQFNGLFGVISVETYKYDGTNVAHMQNYTNYNSIQYNTVYNYNGNPAYSNWSANSNKYLGNILLLKQNSTVGGLVGYAKNANLSQNQAFASIQGNLAEVGGIVGKADGITKISNSSFIGEVNNSGSATGGVVGDASDGQITYAPIALESDRLYMQSKFYIFDVYKFGEDKFFTKTPEINIVNATLEFNNISNTYFRAKNFDGYYLLSNYDDIDYKKSVGFVGSGVKDIEFNIYTTSGVSVQNKRADIMSVNYPTGDVGCSEMSIAVGADLTEVNTAKDIADFIEGVEAYAVKPTEDTNNDGIIDTHSGLSYSTGINSFVFSIQTPWYVNSQVNKGLPVLFSLEKAVLTGEYVGENAAYCISLLANFPPQEIRIDKNQNYKDVFLWELDENSAHVIYFYGLSEHNYTSSNVIDFGNNNINLSSDAIANFTNSLSQQLKKLNTYSIAELFNATSIPSFIKQSNLKIESSHSAILSVELDVDNKISFVAKGDGIVKLTITSMYNTSLMAEVYINVVNAIDTLNLSYFSSGNKKIIENDSTLNISKSTVGNEKSLIINSAVSAGYHFKAGVNGRIDKTFGLNESTGGGVRYYLLKDITKVGGIASHSIYHDSDDIEGLLNSIHSLIKINGLNFSYEFIDSKCVIYVDVPYGDSANFVGLNETLLSFMAVPYVIAYDDSNSSKNIPLIEINKYTDYENILETNVNLVTQFNVGVSKASWAISSKPSGVSFEVIHKQSFEIEVTTDKAEEELFIAYFDENNIERVLKISSLTNNMLQIGNLTLWVNNTVASEGAIIYNFELGVQDKYKLNVQDVFERDFIFFIVKDDVEVRTDSNNYYITSPISEIYDKKLNFPITLNPQEIEDINIKHYPNSEVNIDSLNGDETYEINLNEVAYDNIVPGNVGILKAYISPSYSSFDELIITSSGGGGHQIVLYQMLANVTQSSYGIIYDGTYRAISGTNEKIANGIKLQKISYLNGEGKEEFDGYVYIRTLINSFVTEGTTITLTISAYKNSQLKKTSDIVLDVITPPGISISVDGDKYAPIARGTELDLTVELRDSNTLIDFTESYMYRINRNGLEENLQGYNTYFQVFKRDGIYKVVSNLNTPTDYYFKIIGKVSKNINGQIRTYRDVVTLKVTNYVIEKISAKNVINGYMLGEFNQPYSLVVKVSKATYHASLHNLVMQQIKQIEKDFSLYRDSEGPIKVWKTVVNANASGESRYSSINGLGFNEAKSFKISTRVEPDLRLASDVKDPIVYSVQNTKYDSGDILAAVVKFAYTDDGIVSLMTDDTSILDAYENSGFTFEKVFEFGFNFKRVSNVDAPQPIEDVNDFLNMQDGGDYILVNDLTLKNWKPFRDDLKINSLDGNGYVLTLESFDLDKLGDGDNLTENKNIGVFGKVNAGTMLKNIIVEIKPVVSSNTIESASSASYDLLVDASAYKNINFGVLAGVNAGIITNAQVVYDAGELRLDREIAIAHADPTNEKYANYITKVNNAIEFNSNQFILDNAHIFYPGKKVTEINGVIVVNENNDASARRDLSVVRVYTTVTGESQVHYISAFVGFNSDEGADAIGYITNSSVENITISGVGYVAGFVARNNGKISSSYFKGANVINRAAENFANAATGGFAVVNEGVNSAIQYSYVQGRSGEGNQYAAATSRADKTGLSADIKKEFSGYKYINDTDEKELTISREIASLRAMNSIVTSTAAAGAFVYRNNSLISNTYANIMVNSSMGTSGYAFINDVSGVINSSYTLSSIMNNSMTANPFIGKTSKYEHNNYNLEGINECHYFKMGSGESDTEAEIEYGDVFLDEFKLATSLSGVQFGEYNSFQGYAFNTDFEQNNEEKVTRSVWFIPKASTTSLYKGSFKNNKYIENRPELVAANLKTVSVRVWMSVDEYGKNSYNYASSALGETIYNPILIKSAEEFNGHLNDDINKADKDKNFALRFVSDITFNKTDLTAETYMMDYFGDLDGNGMDINQLRLISKSESNIDSLGLFSRIITQPLDELTSQRGVVRNININVAEVRGSGVTYVGALAGKIENGDVFNVTIAGDNAIIGRNVVGGLAGLISGDSEIVNITTSVKANASYYYTPNRFGLELPNEHYSLYGTYNIYSTKDQGETYSNARNVSYAGGVAGIFDVEGRDDSDEFSKQSLFSAKARKLTATGSVTLFGEVVGGIFGLNGEKSTASDLVFIVDNSARPLLEASRVAGALVGENRGLIERSYVAHSNSIQTLIDEGYKASANINSTLPKFTNSLLNYNSLFGRNAHYIGGLIGFNNYGSIENCYSKINVINMSSMYAGGIVGLNFGGGFDSVYSIGSVSAFKAAGGVIGLQSQYPFVVNDDSSIRYNSFAANNLFININDYSYMGVKVKTLPFSRVVAANVWRDSDLKVDRSEYYSPNLSLGGFIGSAILEVESDGVTHSLDKILDMGRLDERKSNTTNYFYQQKINTNQIIHVPSGMEENSDLFYLMPEIGTLNSLSTLNTELKLIKNDVRFSEEEKEETQEKVEFLKNPMGISGFIEVIEVNDEGEQKVYYQYNRLQNIGSGRTLKEIITTLDVIDTEATAMGAQDDENSEQKEESYNSQPIFSKWSVNRWTGVRTDTVTDISTTFPYLEAKPESSRIEVRNYDDLRLMAIYRNSEFVLCNDIDLSKMPDGITDAPAWEPIGTKALPFRGTLHSAEGKQYTLSNLTINSALNAYVGLVGYATDAEFYNFNLSNVDINIKGVDTAFIGSLVGYSNSGTKINNVNINSAKIETDLAASVGGLAGYLGQGYILNSTINGLEINITGIGEISLLEGSGGHALGFGGLAGVITSLSNTQPTVAKVVVKGEINLGTSTTAITMPSDTKIGEANELHIGGVIGRVNDAESQRATINNAESDVNITTVIKFSKKTDVLKAINIGGAIGTLRNAAFAGVLIDDKDENTELDENKVDGKNNIEISGYNKKVNYGGAIGQTFGIVQSSDNSDYEIAFVDVNAKKVSSVVKVLKPTGFSEGENNIGGVVGYAYNAKIEQVNVIVDTDVTIEENEYSNIGGFAGLIENGQIVKNVYVGGELNVISDGNAEAIVSMGGFAGSVAMSYNSMDGIVGEIKKSITNLNITTTSQADGITVGKFNIGGFLGLINAGNVNQCIAGGLLEIANQIGNEMEICAGGFVGVADLKSKLTSSIPNKIIIQNCYTTAQLDLRDIFNTDNSFAGLFVGNIIYAYKTNGFVTSLTLKNNYTLASYIYTDDSNAFYTSLYEENENKGGFLGGFTISDVDGVTISNIEKVSNLLFINNFYNKELVPYANDYMTGLTTDEMLVESSTTFGGTSFNTENAELGAGVNYWIISNYKYPILSWTTSQYSKDALVTENKVLVYIVENKENSILGKTIASIQEEGKRVSPVIVADSSGYSSYESLVFKTTDANKLDNIKGENQHVYFVDNATITTDFNLESLDRYSMIYGINSEVTSSKYLITSVNGMLVNSTIKYKALFKNNNGVIYNAQVTSSSDLGNANNGAIDIVHTKDLAGNIVDSNNESGSIYRTVIKNGAKFTNTDTNNGKIKTSYIMWEEKVDGYLFDKIQYYDNDGVSDYDNDGVSETYNVYNQSTKKINATFKDFKGNFLDISLFDFDKDWVVIDSSDKELNYGMPILRYELKARDALSDIYNDIDSKYYWSKEIVSESDFNTLVNKYKGKTLINVESADEFANIANVVSWGYQTSASQEIAKSVSTVLRRETSDVKSKTGYNNVTFENYKFGVLSKVSKNLMNFKDVTLVLDADIDLSDKLWTPIGFGFDNKKLEFNDTISLGLHNMFAGKIDGQGHYITGASVVETNRNVGIFGTINISGLSETQPFASSLVIKDSNFISVSKNSGYAVAGALAGRLAIEYNNANAIDKVGTENANVYATNRASGLIGDIANYSNISTPDSEIRSRYVKIKYAYANSDVYVLKGDRNNASAFTHYANNVRYSGGTILKGTAIDSTAYEMYFGGSVGALCVSDYANISAIGNYPYNKPTTTRIYLKLFSDDNIGAQQVTENELKTIALKNFTWGDIWVRIGGYNNNYPVLNTQLDYWVLHSEQVTESNNGYEIGSAAQLAWVAEQVNTEALLFEKKTVKLMSDIDLSGKLWSPIGYSADKSFKGKFDFNGKTIKGINASAVYEKDDSQATKVKSVNINYVGLFGHITNAIITSSAGMATLGTDSELNRVVGTYNVGGLIAYAQNSSIENITVNVIVASAKSIKDYDYMKDAGMGGVVGKLYGNNTVRNVVNNGALYSTRDNTGGVVGYATGAKNGSSAAYIDKAINKGKIVAFNDNVGGVLGYGNEDVYVYINGIDNWLADGSGINTSATPDNSGQISGNNYVGGIVGQLVNGDIEAVTNSGNISAVQGGGGGVVGRIHKANVYEAINIGNIVATGAGGGIIGSIHNAGLVVQNEIVNLLNSGKVASSEIDENYLPPQSTPDKGLIIGKIENTYNDVSSLYAAIDISSNVSNANLVGGVNGINSQFYLSRGMSNLITESMMNAETTIVYGDSNGVKIKFESVYQDNLVWDIDATTIKLKYNTKPSGVAPEVVVGYGDDIEVEIASGANLLYASDINKKRFGVASIKGELIIENNLTVENMSQMGKGAYPWRLSIDGKYNNITIDSFKEGSSSLLGDVLGVASNLLEVKNLTLKYKKAESGADLFVKNGGLLINLGAYVKTANLSIGDSDNVYNIKTSGAFGALARDLYNSHVGIIDVYANITSESVTVLGGVVGYAKDTNITGDIGDINKKIIMHGDINASNASKAAIVGGIVGQAIASESDVYSLTNCVVVSNINATSASGTTGGIVGYVNNYQLALLRYGEHTFYKNDKNEDKLKKRVGYIKGSRYVGGIVGEAENIKVQNLANYGNVDGKSNKSVYVGGIVGYGDVVTNYGETSAKNLFNYGLVTSSYAAGGFAGLLKSNNNTIISLFENDALGEVVGGTNKDFTYSNLGTTITGIVSSTAYVGGVVGYAKNIIINNCGNTGFVAAGDNATTETNVGGIAGEFKNDNNSSIESCKVEGYVGLFKISKNNNRGYFSNFYYSDYNVDSENGNTDYDRYSYNDEKSGIFLKFNKWSRYSFGGLVGNGSGQNISVSDSSFTGLEGVILHDYYIEVEKRKVDRGGGTWHQEQVFVRGYETTYSFVGKKIDIGVGGAQLIEDDTKKLVDNDSDSAKRMWPLPNDPDRLPIGVKFDAVNNENASIEIEANGNTTQYIVTFYPDPDSEDKTTKRFYEDTPIELLNVQKVFSSNESGTYYYEFAGWFTAKDGGIKIDKNYVVSENLSLYARWAEPQVELTIFIDFASTYAFGKGEDFYEKYMKLINSIPIKGTINFESSDFMLVDNDNNYRLDKWYRGYSEEMWNSMEVGDKEDYLESIGYSKDVIDYEVLRVTGSIPFTGHEVLYTIWVPIVTVTFMDGEVELEKITLDKGEKISKFPEVEGKDFKGWYTTEGILFNSDSVVNENLSVYAVWQNIATFKYNYEGAPSDELKLFDAGSTGAKVIALLLPTREHYDFEGWYNDANVEVQFNLTATYSDDVTLYAKWKLKTYTVIFKYRYGDDENVGVTAFATVSKPDTPTRDNYIFNAWYVLDSNGNQTNQYDFDSLVTSNLTLGAEWLDAVIVTFYNFQGEGNAEIKQYKVVKKRQFEKDFPINPVREGYTFNGWVTSDGTSFAENDVINGNMSVFGSWTINKYSVLFIVNYVDYSSESNNETLFTLLNIDYGSTIKKEDVDTTELSKNYEIIGWYTDIALANAFNFDGTVKGNLTLYAKLEYLIKDATFNLNYIIDGDDVYEVVKFKKGELVELPKNPTRDNYNFDGWFIDIDEAGLIAFDEEVAYDTDMQIYAKWVEYNPLLA